MACFANPKNVQATTSTKPVLLFLHGSFHGAWCWAEHYLPYFTSDEQGYAAAVAVSWRGTGGTPAGEGVKKVKLLEHVDDLTCLLEDDETPLNDFLKRQCPVALDDTRPVLICHSFAGLAVMKYLEQRHAKSNENAGMKGGSSMIRGVVTFCSVPPSGNGKVTMRYLRRSLIDSWKITAGIAMKRCLHNARLCRQLFFGGDVVVVEEPQDYGATTTTRVVDDHGLSDADIERFQSYFARDSTAVIDILDLSRHLPSKATNAQTGRALFLSDASAVSSLDGEGNASTVLSQLPVLVVGATQDFLVDQEALEETAQYFGLDGLPLLVDSPHDVMLGAKWRNGADALSSWLSQTFAAAAP